MRKDKRKTLGRLGESIATDYLIKNGYTILENNFKVHRLGEIDIVAKQGESICFMEVKTRTGDSFGIPSEAVIKQKQEKIKRLAQVYIKKNSLFEHDIRFDVVEIIVTYPAACKNGGKHEYEVRSINLIENAFY
ncbi:MAG: YraN family protein [Clostridiaceae bacterium]|nr:YraN family protein [Clostridiaceae bacterium]